jgi:5'-nucleotidase
VRAVRVLITNDDGIGSEGLHLLAATVVGLGHDVVVAAPDRDLSGSGASIGRVHMDERLEVRRVEVPGCEGVPAWGVVAPPAMCVLAARLGAFGEPPDLVVSGINPGANTGRAILHSGTVGAALTAQNFGAKGLAVSVDWAEPLRFDTACRCAAEVLEMIEDAPPRTVLNLNVPAVGSRELLGIRWARLDAFGSVRSSIAESEDGHLQFELVATDREPAPDTDRGMLSRGYASLTSVVGVAEAWPDSASGEELPQVTERTVPGAPVVALHGPDPATRLSLRLHA